MRKGIASAGNWLVDFVKIIEEYPAAGNLVTISRQQMGLGGCSHNVLANLAKMDTGIPLYAGGCVGNDPNGRYILDEIDRLGIDGSGMVVVQEVPTSYTDVMTEKQGGVRTFFHCRGANAELDFERIAAMRNDARIFHLGYLLLLDKLDARDEQYGVTAAKVLKSLRDRGYRTSVDMVSEQSNRYMQVLYPCLPHIDYLIINEIEAGKSTGLEIRTADGNFSYANLKMAAQSLIDKGACEQVSIHLPEGGFTLLKDGRSCFVPSFHVPHADIVSSVGAGDAFCAGMLYAIHEQYDIREALSLANASARFNLFSATSTGGAPTFGEIADYLKNQNLPINETF